MRFVLVSTHTEQTIGYSKVAYNLLKQLSTLSPRVKTFHFGFQRHPSAAGIRKLPAGIIQYDAAANEEPKEEGFGFNRIHEYIDMVTPDIVMIYNDPLVTCKFIESMKHDPKTSKYKLWIYLDQVYDGIAQPLIEKIRQHADSIYCFTDLWRQRLAQYGKFDNVHVLEHAADPTIFQKLPGDVRQAVRKSMGIPENAVVFFNANRNSQRKRLDVCIQGFARYLVKNQNAYLVLATGVNPQLGAYYDIQRIYMRELARLGLPEILFTRLVLVDTSGQTAIGDESINQIYNATDIGINTSDGEGYGLCQLEHLYVGAPQIVTDVGSYRSFMDESVAAFVPGGVDTYFSGNMPMGGWAPTFSPDDIASAMEHVVSKLPEMREAASNYKFKTWSSVCDNWLEDLLGA